MKYIFQGGLANHRCKGYICSIAWQFETDPNYYMVYFENAPMEYEMARLDELKEIK
jgi:hypothetical protein